MPRGLLMFACALLLSVGGVVGLFAQAAPTDQQGANQAPAQAPASGRSLVLTEGRVLSFDLGFGGGLPFNGGAVEVSRYVAFDANVGNAVAAGVADITTGAVTYLAFRVSYFILPTLGATVYLGSNGNPAGGIGLFYDVLKSRPDAGLATALKVRLDCLADTSGFANGRLILSVVSSIGI